MSDDDVPGPSGGEDGDSEPLLGADRTVDLGGEAPPAPSDMALGPTTKTVGQLREVTRGRLAGGLTFLLAAIILGAGIVVALNPSKLDPMVELLKLVFTPVVALVGSAVGFYFGSNALTGDAEDAPRAGGVLSRFRRPRR